MPQGNVSPYGSWASPVTSDLIVSDNVKLVELAIDGEEIYWVEMRPTEAGRYVLVRCSFNGNCADVTPESFNVRTRVHEYGGGAFVAGDGAVCFSNFSDQRLYRQSSDGTPTPITPETDTRYADGVFDRQHDRLICVREDHTVPDAEAVNCLVSKRLDGIDGGEVIVSGRDFYASPRLSPDGTKLAWVEWDHPNMPWDGTELCVADRAADGSLGETIRIAGGLTESVLQPEWSPDGVLYFLSDRSGWWNLYRWVDQRAESLCSKDAEFGYPMWVFGMSSYGFQSTDSLICTYAENGIQYLASLDTRTLELKPLTTPFCSFRNLQVGSDFAVFVAGSLTRPTVVARIDLNTNDIDVLRHSSSVDIEEGYLSVPQAMTFPTEHGLTSHGYYYAPKNGDFEAPENELPPLLVKSHGGPTSATSSDFNLTIQYWTSRGFAVMDVNYGGSTGYGRAYRDRLRGEWGVVDVDDCVNSALYLARQRLADENRLAIDGGSAGGYTTLNALTFRDVFHAGASLYGISDLTVFVGDTHKFESRYLDSLIGPYPQCRDLYAQRSAINFVDQLSCPVIFFQGDEDKIVPPNQAELMVEALRNKGLPVAYLLFAGEQHGFRQSQNIKRALDAELYFYSRVFGFETADEIEPVEIT